VSRTVFLLIHNPVFSNSHCLALVFDGVVALVGAAQCLLFMQFQALMQALPLPDADSAV
jgi:predicted Co/Zn/Cd cation transporter (cation efflux family)